MTIATIQYGAAEFTNPLPDTPSLPIPNPIITSDSFSGPDAPAIIGLETDAALGGTPELWRSQAAYNWPRTGGRLVGPNTLGAAFVRILGHTDIEASVKFAVLPTAAGPALSVRALDTSTSLANDSYRVAIPNTGIPRLERRFDGAALILGNAPGPLAAGDRLGIRVVGTTVSLLVNGVVVFSATNASVASGGYVGLSQSADSGGWQIDDFIVRLIDHPEAL